MSARRLPGLWGTSRSRLLLAVAVGLIAAGHTTLPLRAQQRSAVTLQHQEGDSLTARAGDVVLWQLHYGLNQPKPFFHPVALPDGRVMTWNSPPDHPWHHGLWFSWKYINGVNYWEPNSQTGKPDGRTIWHDVHIESLPDQATSIRMNLAYGPGESATVLTEDRSIVVSEVDDEGNYHFDWTCAFTAVAEKVVLDRTPLPDQPGGEVYGGYAGLSVRFPQDLTDREATSSAGPVEFSPQERYRGRATAMDYAGTHGAGPAGIAICDHPANLNHPSPWYVIRSAPMSYYSPAVICYEPHTMQAGESFTLRYRVIVHSGKWNAQRLVEEYQRFVRESPAAPDR